MEIGDVLVWVLGIVAGVLTLGAIGLMVGIRVRTRRQGRTPGGQLIMQATGTVVSRRRLGAHKASDLEVVFQHDDGTRSALVAEAAAASRLKKGQRGEAKWAAGRLIAFTPLPQKP